MVKKILMGLLFLCAFDSLLYAAEVQWRSWKVAIEEVKNTDKIIMVDIIRDGCRYCVKMEKNVFHDEKMVVYIHKHFIPVKINLSKEVVPLGIKVDMTPSFLFFSSDIKLIKKIPGSWNQKDFYDFLDKIIVQNKDTR